MHDEFQHGYDWDDLFEKDLENDIPPGEDLLSHEPEPPETFEEWDDQ